MPLNSFRGSHTKDHEIYAAEISFLGSSAFVEEDTCFRFKSDSPDVTETAMVEAISGFAPVAVARDVTGLQWGLVNVAGKITRVSLGLNIANADGGILSSIFTSSALLPKVGLKLARGDAHSGFLSLADEPFASWFRIAANCVENILEF